MIGGNSKWLRHALRTRLIYKAERRRRMGRIPKKLRRTKPQLKPYDALHPGRNAPVLSKKRKLDMDQSMSRSQREVAELLNSAKRANQAPKKSKKKKDKLAVAAGIERRPFEPDWAFASRVYRQTRFDVDRELSKVTSSSL